MKVEQVNNFINSRYCMLAIALLSVTCSFIFYVADIHAGHNRQGLFFSNPNEILSPGLFSWTCNTAVILATALILNLLNKAYGFIREYTSAYVSLFLVFSLTDPDVAGMLSPATLLSFVYIICCTLIFNSYQRPERRSAIFIVIATATACSLFDKAALLLVPICLIGFAQVQAMSFKGILAALLGLVLPFWIGFGFGLLDLSSLSLPQLSFSPERYCAAFDTTTIIRIVTAIAANIAFGTANFFTIISYRLQLRSYNGFFNVTSVATLIFMLLDVTNIDTYIDLFNLCVAIQAAHFFTISHMKHKYVLFFLLLAVWATCAAIDLVVNYSYS